MRDDLLDSNACVDWAITQLDVLEHRIDAWRKSSPYGIILHKDSETGNETWQVGQSDPIPRLINAEAGAVINSLRSSLDILANKLAERNGNPGKKDVYFPVCKNLADFNGRSPRDKRSGREKIKWLSATDCTAIETLQPYHGGDDSRLLLALHQMDNARKHRQLIKFGSSAAGIGVYKFGVWPQTDEQMRRQGADDGYVLVRGQTNPDYQIQVRIEVSILDAGVLTGKPVIPALRELAGLANRVIDIFDTIFDA